MGERLPFLGFVRAPEKRVDIGNTLWHSDVIALGKEKTMCAKPAPQPEDRLSIRANTAQKMILRRAAEVRHTTMSKFVLEVSLAEADRILKQETTLRVSDAEYDWLCQLMDQPARELPELRDLVSEKPVWDV
jgi:uncharacterized protein (DUF1778 family)